MAETKKDPRSIAILYEHPEWFKPLFAELDRRGLPYDLWLAHEHQHDPRVRRLPNSLVLNRMSPSSYLRDHGNGIFYTRQLLAYLKNIGVPVINPYEAYMVETSKALQIEILEQLELRYPRTRIINHPSLALEAAQGFDFPIIIKPNIGGSGARIQKFNSRQELRHTVKSGVIDLGFDFTALVQEFCPAEDGAIVRVEVLDGEFLYAIKIFTEQNGNFNLCPADICQDENANSQLKPPESKNGTTGPSPSAPGEQDFSRCLAADRIEKRRMHIEPVTPSREIIEAVLRIARKARIDVGGIEYLVSTRDGNVYFYDINALSNFVTEARTIVGFDPYERLVDFVQQRAYQEV